MHINLTDVYNSVYYHSMNSDRVIKLVTIDIDSFREICQVMHRKETPRYLTIKSYWYDCDIRVVPTNNSGINLFDKDDEIFVFALKVGLFE